MKAIVKSKAEEGLWLEDVPEPEIGINDVLIRVLKTGICGTDVHIYNWDAWAQSTIKIPTILGHEIVGEIIGSRLERQRFLRGRYCQRRRSSGLRTLSQLSCRTACQMCKHARNRCADGRRFCRIYRRADDEYLETQRQCGSWMSRRSSIRSATPFTRLSRLKFSAKTF